MVAFLLRIPNNILKFLKIINRLFYKSKKFLLIYIHIKDATLNLLGYQNLNQNRFDQAKFNLNVDLVRLRINEKTFLNHTPFTLLELSFLFWL